MVGEKTVPVGGAILRKPHNLELAIMGVEHVDTKGLNAFFTAYALVLRLVMFCTIAAALATWP